MKEELDERLFKEKTVDSMKNEVILYSWVLSVHLVLEMDLLFQKTTD